jgi:phenylpropionate dioxygenase-like ring-hydroxylating dioxygenase large terminal subunit
MLSTKQPVLRKFWYPVMRMTHLESGPKPFTLLGENIVVWKTTDGKIACLKDRCCHRTAKLSLGFLEGDNVVCGYHGWTFAPSGKCVRIPQFRDDTRTGNVGVPAYRTAERYGYAWVALEEPVMDLPDLPEASQDGFRQVHQFYEPWNIGGLRLMENSFDAAHVAYVHRATFGNMAAPEISVHRDITPKPYGFDSLNVQPVKVRGDQAQRFVQTTEGDTVRRTNSSWYIPFIRRAAIHYPHGLIHVLVTCATPMTDTQSMILQWVYRNDTEADVSTADVIAFDRAVTLEDKAILESCDPDVPLAVIDGEELHMGSDRPGLTMRRMLNELLKKHGESEARSA